MTEQAPPISGLVNLYKPAGRSSAQYVYRLRPRFGIRKIGHAGTLDPFADGVLLACLGRATKLVERLYGQPKRYRTTLRLGVTNACYDTELPYEIVSTARPLPVTDVETAVETFVGNILQVPPSYSAVKINGVSSYQLAKKGKPAPREPKPVRIDSIEILAYEWPHLTLDIRCGRGTYIRAIARDLGQQLECGAVCETLSRLSVGPFTIEDAVRLDAASPEALQAALIPVDQVESLLAQPPSQSSSENPA